jgi:hypothetical protein
MKNLIAIVILVVLGIVAVITFREKPNTEKEKVESAIKPVDQSKIDTIKVNRFEGRDDDRKPESYTLKKIGETWRMVEPVDYPVVASTVDSMTKVLGELRVIDVISEKPSSHEKFEVDKEHGVHVTAMSGSETLVELIVGQNKAGITFVRLPKSDKVYRLKGGIRYNLDRSIKTLREKAIVKIEMDDLDKVVFTQKDASLTLAREGEGSSVTVKPVGTEIENFDNNKATGVVRSGIRLHAVDFVDEKLPAETTGLDETADKYVVEGKKDDKPYTVTVFLGKKKEDKSQVYTKSSESDQIYLISNFTAERLRAKAADFVKEEEKKDDEKPAQKKGPKLGKGGPAAAKPAG